MEEENISLLPMLEIIHNDRKLLSQLEYIGIRSALELAYENPIKLFVETDLNLIASIKLVDHANFYLFVTEKSIRQELNKLGIHTAIDLMIQVYHKLPTPQADGKTKSKWRFLKLEEQIPEYMLESLISIAKIMHQDNVEVLRGTIHMMIDNPQLIYLFNLWAMFSERVEDDEFNEDIE